MGTTYRDDLKLIEAAESGDFDLVEQLLRRGADPNAKHVIHCGTPLKAAAASGHLEVAKLLVQHGADINMEAGEVRETALVDAAITGRVEMVRWLLKMGAAVPDEDSWNELMKDLAKFGETQIISLIEEAVSRQNWST